MSVYTVFCTKQDSDDHARIVVEASGLQEAADGYTHPLADALLREGETSTRGQAVIEARYRWGPVLVIEGEVGPSWWLGC